MTNPLIECDEPVNYDPDIKNDEIRIQAGVLRDILDTATFNAVMLIHLRLSNPPFQVLNLLVKRGYKNYIKDVENA